MTDEALKTYVWEGTEVKLTGRTANRTVGRETARRKPKQDVVHEITPADKENGSWKKWVRMHELYEIDESDA